jgi:ligand-binding SRPBCC domain-containing protein
VSHRYVLDRTQFVPVPLDRTFEFYAEPRNLARITPKWLGFRIVGFDDGETADATMRRGLRIHYRVKPLGFPQRWTSEITEWDPPGKFVDEQRAGPYRSWHHEHTFRAVDGGTEIRDRVEYALPFGPLGRIAHALLVRRQLEAIFDHREEVVHELLG